jgi:enhancing lycopene biosynthesis protein 2
LSLFKEFSGGAGVLLKKIAVILAGCGHQDGTEITEAVSLWVALSQLQNEVHFFAPDMTFTVQNHKLKQSSLGEIRNVLVESARISRGKVTTLAELRADEFDGLAFPGGFGAALYLSNWAHQGARCEVHAEVAKLIMEFYQKSKPIAAICIAPVLIAKVLGSKKITLTVGESPSAIQEIRKTGALHEICPVDDFITDRDHKIITTPAYMYDQAKAHEVFIGISKLARELTEMA